jgi:hypothetical protein
MSSAAVMFFGVLAETEREHRQQTGSSRQDPS